MNRTRVALMCLGTFLLGMNLAEAQTNRFGARRPVTSPYLNLLNENNDAAYNYYRSVKPEMEFRQATQSNRASIGRLQTREAAVERTLNGYNHMSGTGHGVEFGSTRQFFPGRSGR